MAKPSKRRPRAASAPKTREPAADVLLKLLLSYGELVGLGVPFSRVHLRRLVAAGKFPAPIRLSEGRIAWRTADVVAWLNAQAPEWQPAAE